MKFTVSKEREIEEISKLFTTTRGLNQIFNQIHDLCVATLLFHVRKGAP